jgi:hypothetical protein
MATLDWSQCPAVESVPGRLSGAWVFRDTRMPVSAVFENLEAGATVDAEPRLPVPWKCETSRQSQPRDLGHPAPGASLRSRARPAGRCGLQPKPISSFHTWPG